MNNQANTHIAEQALKALLFRRQFERGELTHEEYVARLNALEGTAEQAAAPPRTATADPAYETGVSMPTAAASEPRPKLVGALQLLQLRRRLENGQLTPQEYRTQLDAQPDMPALPHVAEREPEPLEAATPIAAPPAPAAPAIVTSEITPEELPDLKPARTGDHIVRWSRGPRNHRLRWALATAAGILALIAGTQALAFRESSHSRKSAMQDIALAVPEVRPADLIVSEAGFVGPAERSKVAGVLSNRSGRAYTDIQLTFSLVGPDGDTVGLATATVDHIGGHGTAKFESPDEKPKAAELVLQHIETRTGLAFAR